MEKAKCGKIDCSLCETCIYDVDLFPEGVSTEKKIKTTENTMMKPICNYCGYLTKSFNGTGRRFFNACCMKKLVETGNVKRPMVIEYQTYEMANIERPDWCPMLANNSGNNETITPSQNQLSLPNKTEEDKEKENTIQKPFKELTYFEKKEVLKTLTPRLKWEDIKENGYYLIPKIMTTPKKIIHIESKNEECIRCHEVSEITKAEFSYVTTIHPEDVEAVFIVELHEF